MNMSGNLLAKLKVQKDSIKNVVLIQITKQYLLMYLISFDTEVHMSDNNAFLH